MAISQSDRKLNVKGPLKPAGITPASALRAQATNQVTSGTILASNAPLFNAEKMAAQSIDETIIPKIERIVGNDLEMGKEAWRRVSAGGGIGENIKGLWKGMVENSGGSKIKAGSRLGAYAAGVAMVADLLNPLSPGWGD